MSALLKKLFENHVTGDANEELVKAAAHGDYQKCEEVSIFYVMKMFLLCLGKEKVSSLAILVNVRETEKTRPLFLMFKEKKKSMTLSGMQ